MSIDDSFEPIAYQKTLLKQLEYDPYELTRDIIKTYHLFLEQARKYQLEALQVSSIATFLQTDGDKYVYHMHKRWETAAIWIQKYIAYRDLPLDDLYSTKDYWLGLNYDDGEQIEKILD